MNATLRRDIVICALLTGTCAAPTQQITSTPAPPAAKGEDTGFVLSRKPTGASAAPAGAPLHTGEKWWPFRAAQLGISEQEVRDRDGEISEVQAPDKFWDPQTAKEAVGLWSGLCNECHGGRRRLEDAATMPAPAANWGRGEGLFFGARRRYADVFFTVYRGGPERNGMPSEMPAWRGKIAKEMIWALLYFLEYQSGGIEGRFPPSLYPKRDPRNAAE